MATSIRTPRCFLCHRDALITLPAAIVTALTAGTPTQDALPEWSRPAREQLISGTHPDCWALAFGAGNSHDEMEE